MRCLRPRASGDAHRGPDGFRGWTEPRVMPWRCSQRGVGRTRGSAWPRRGDASHTRIGDGRQRATTSTLMSTAIAPRARPGRATSPLLAGQPSSPLAHAACRPSRAATSERAAIRSHQRTITAPATTAPSTTGGGVCPCSAATDACADDAAGKQRPDERMDRLDDLQRALRPLRRHRGRRAQFRTPPAHRSSIRSLGLPVRIVRRYGSFVAAGGAGLQQPPSPAWLLFPWRPAPTSRPRT